MYQLNVGCLLMYSFCFRIVGNGCLGKKHGTDIYFLATALIFVSFHAIQLQILKKIWFNAFIFFLTFIVYIDIDVLEL